MANPSGPPTAFDSVTVSGVPTMGMAGVPLTSGNVWFVNSVTGSAGNTGTANSPLETLAGALAKAVANNGDVIVLEAGHAETITAAAGININVAGITIVTAGQGAQRATFTFTTSTAATITITAASVTFGQPSNPIIGVCGIDQIVSPFVVSGANFSGAVEWQDGGATTEALRAFLTTATASNFNLSLKYLGFPAGTHGVNAVRLVGCAGAALNLNYYGKASTSIVEFFTTACTNVNVTGYFYNSGTIDLSKNVVDTVTGSTWAVQGYDGAAGLSFDGGSAKAIGGTDVTAVIANQAVATANGTANALERDVGGNKTDTAVTAVGTTNSIIAYAKGILTWIGTLLNTGGTATLGAVLGDFANTTLVAKLNVPTANAAANTAVTEVVGNKTDAAVYGAQTTKSLTGYAKGIISIAESASLSGAAVMSTGLTVFNIAGGPIEITSLASICQTANGAALSTLQWTAVGTLGATSQTITGASASLANATAGTSVIAQLTALATAPVINVNGAGVVATPNGVIVPAGSLQLTIAAGPTTGTWIHYIRYKPLALAVTVSAAF